MQPGDSPRDFTRAVLPLVPRLDAALRRAWPSHDAREIRALANISPGAAARVFASGGSFTDFQEQVAYHSRRLAKLNVPPSQVAGALHAYEAGLESLPPETGSLRRLLHDATLLELNNAYYQVREAETQAFYGLMRAELDATGLDDLLRRFIGILTRTFRAQAG